MFIYGNRLFGKVDAVPGVGHVATKCFHFNFVPLVPSEGWLVMSESGNKWRGLKIPISWKSYLVAWARFITGCVVFLGVILVLVGIADPDRNIQLIVIGAVTALVGVALHIGLKKVAFINRASYARACELAIRAGLRDDTLIALAKAYNEPPISSGYAPTTAAPAVEEEGGQ